MQEAKKASEAAETKHKEAIAKLESRAVTAETQTQEAKKSSEAAEIKYKEAIAKLERERDMFRARAINAETNLEETNRTLQEAFSEETGSPMMSSSLFFTYGQQPQQAIETDEDRMVAARMIERTKKLQFEASEQFEADMITRMSERAKKLQLAADAQFEADMLAKSASREALRM